MTCRKFPIDGVKLMKLKINLVIMLLVSANGRALVPIEKTRDRNKGHWGGANPIPSDT